MEQRSKKIRIFRIAGAVITICITVCLLCFCTNLMERKASAEKYKAFFDQKEDFDVLFFGTSHVINGVFPMELWDDYGIVSYNCGGHANQIATSYWVMRNMLERTDPKVVVIDCMEVESNKKSSTDFSYLHYSLDALPLSITKLQTIWDLLDDPYYKDVKDHAFDEDVEDAEDTEDTEDAEDVKPDESEDYGKEPRTRIGLLWDYSVYHSRWSVIDRFDFEPEVKFEKGAESRLGVVRKDLDRISGEEKIQPGTTGDVYLRKMIEYCQDQGIDVVLMYLPFPANETQQQASNYVYDLAEEYQIPYLNYLDMDVINYHTDLYDRDHVNPSGARKITDRLGQFLTSNYDIPDRRQDPDYSTWFDDYEQYENVKNINITTVEDLETYLSLLSGDDLEIRMDVRNKELFLNDWILELFDNLGVDTEKLSNKTDYIMIQDPAAAARASDEAGTSTAVLILEDIRKNGRSQETGLGTFEFRDDGLYLDGQEYLTGDLEEDTGLRIDVYRGTDLVDSVQFAYFADPDDDEIHPTAVYRE